MNQNKTNTLCYHSLSAYSAAFLAENDAAVEKTIKILTAQIYTTACAKPSRTVHRVRIANAKKHCSQSDV